MYLISLYRKYKAWKERKELEAMEYRHIELSRELAQLGTAISRRKNRMTF